MAGTLNSPDQHYMIDGINVKDTQSVDPFTDPYLLIVVSIIGLIALVGTLISCICCDRRNSRSGFRHASSSGSLRDTVQLEDLLSKPTLADPESVFSEFVLDARISEDASSQTTGTVDETTHNSALSSRSSSVFDSCEEPRGKSMGKTGSKSYRKESRKKSNQGLNNSNGQGSSIYKKNSTHSQTLQNDLAYVSNRMKNVQNKLENYDKKVTEALQQESDVRKENNLNVEKDLEEAESTKTEQQKYQEIQSSLEVLNASRASSGSECVSFTSSARGSVCHDIGTPVNAFRLHRPSIYPRMDGGGRAEGKPDIAGDDMCSLPDVLESPGDSTVHSQDDDDDQLLSDPQEENSEKHCRKDSASNSNVTSMLPRQNEHTKDLCYRNKTKCLQKAYSVDRAFHDHQQCGKLPERISLNLQIDFHFPNQGQSQCQGEGAIPIVVCAPVSFNNSSNVQNTIVPTMSKLDSELQNKSCCNSVQPENNEPKDEQPKPDDSTHTVAVSISSNDNSNVISRQPRRTNKKELASTKSATLQMTSRIPFWVKNRLSEPVEFSHLLEKVSNSPRLKRRSFTIADFKSLTFRSVANIYDEEIPENSRNVRNTTESPEQSKGVNPDLSTNAADDVTDLPRIVPDDVGTSECRYIQGGEGNRTTTSCESNNINDEAQIENDLSNSVTPDTEKELGNVTPPTVSNTVGLEIGEHAEEGLISDTESQDYEKPTIEVNGVKVDMDETSGKPSDVDVCEHSDDESEYYMESDLVFDNNEDTRQMAHGVGDDLYKDKQLDEDKQDSNEHDNSVFFDGVCVEKRVKPDKSNLKRSMSCERDNSKLEENNHYRLTRSSSLGFIPYVPFVPSVVVTNSDGVETDSRQTSQKSLCHDTTTNDDDHVADTAVSESDPCKVVLRVRKEKSTRADDRIDRCDNRHNVIIGGGHIEVENKEYCSKTTKRKPMEGNSVHDNDTVEVGSSMPYPNTSRPRGKLNNPTSDEMTMEIGSSQTYPKSCRPKSKTTDPRNDGFVMETDRNQSSPNILHQKARSADTTMESEVMGITRVQNCPGSSDLNTNSADTTMDTNVASDDSDYDNPWDSIENAVKRASMKYHKRPSVAASSVRDLKLKSAEDLGRLIELAETRRRERLNSTKSTCHEFESDDNPAPPFMRASPLRHTVKGVMSSRSSNEDLGRLGGKPKRGKAGSKSLRVSKDDSAHNLKTAESSKPSSGKSWKFYSPETKKKLKK